MEKERIVIAFVRQNGPPDLTSQVKNTRNTAVFLDLTWQAKIPCTGAYYHCRSFPHLKWVLGPLGPLPRASTRVDGLTA